MMQQLQAANSVAPGTSVARRFPAVIRRWLTGRRGLITAGLGILAAGLALDWNWLTAIGVAPVILSLAPCAVMCAIGACAMIKGNSPGGNGTATGPASAQEPPPAVSTPEEQQS
jgi:hypothetical protein